MSVYVRYQPIVLGSGGGGGGGVTSVGPFGSTPNADGGDISGSVLTLEPADATRPGGVSTTTQSFAGNKTFTGTIAASNLSGTNTGDVTLGTANGLGLTAQVLSLALASTSTTGALSSTDWNTFNNKGSGTVSSIGTIDGQTASANGLVISGSSLYAQSASASNPGMLNITAQTIAGVKTFTSTIVGTTSGNVVASTGDIAETSFSLNNNQASLADIATFDVSGRRSFLAYCSVYVNASPIVAEAFIITGVNYSGIWFINTSSTIGDSGLILNMSNAGIMQYTTPVYSGFVSATLKFRVLVTEV